MAFFSLASGPSASTRRHFMNTSQYPLKSLQGEPAGSVVTFLLKKRARRSDPVLLQVLGFTEENKSQTVNTIKMTKMKKV